MKKTEYLKRACSEQEMGLMFYGMRNILLASVKDSVTLTTEINKLT